MVENGFVYAVNKLNMKKAEKERKQADKKQKAYETIKIIQEKYNFCFGYMTKEDTNRMNKTDRTKYYKAIKLTTTYSDEFLKTLNLC